MVVRTKSLSSAKAEAIGRRSYYNRPQHPHANSETISTRKTSSAAAARYQTKHPHHRPVAASYDRSEHSDGSATFSKKGVATAPPTPERTPAKKIVQPKRISSRMSSATDPDYDQRQPPETTLTQRRSYSYDLHSAATDPTTTTPRKKTIEPREAVPRQSEVSIESLRVSSSSCSQSYHFRQGMGDVQETLEPLPEVYWKRLEELKFHYPGWEKDYTQACESYHFGEEQNFVRAYRKLRDKQRVYNDYKAFSRMSELANLKLTYPGYEADKEALEKWHLNNPSSDAEDSIFQDKLEGLRNKEKLFFGNRTHPNIVALDALDLTYPNWEVDYQIVVGAHCSSPARKFDIAFHRLQEKQKMYIGNRSHWRLAILDRLSKTLTYPGWEDDVAHVERWHVESLDNERNGRMFSEVLEGMKDQQQIFLGWNHEGNGGNDEDDHHSLSDESLEAQGVFYKLDLQNAEEMRRSYNSITSSLQQFEGKRKQLLERRSASPVVSIDRRPPLPTDKNSSFSSSDSSDHDSPSPPRHRRNPPSRTSSYRRRSPSPAASSHRRRSQSASPYERSRSGTLISRGRTPSFQGSQSHNNSPSIAPNSSRASGSGIQVSAAEKWNDRLPPKQKKLGSCVVCYSRDKTHVFTPCGHMCVCAACSDETMKTTKCCPICNTQSDSSFRVFVT